MNVTNPPVPTMYTVCEAMKECGVNDTDLFEGKIQAERQIGRASCRERVC